jgi:hypothetical protein
VGLFLRLLKRKKKKQSQRAAAQLPKHLCRRSKKPSKFNKNSIHSLRITPEVTDTEYKFPFVKELNPNPVNRPGMDYRSSLSWFNPELSVRKYRAIPFVSQSGKLSIHTLCVWKSYPEQVIMSLVSTIYSRISKILRKRNHKVGRRLLNSAFKCSIVYAITRNNWLIDRFLGMSLRTPIKKVEAFIHYCVCALDENKRFVYSQAYSQANWLKFQVFRPCDKSRKEVWSGSHLRNLFLGEIGPYDEARVSEAFKRSSDLWEVTPIRSGKSSIFSRYRPSAVTLGSYSDLSELITFNREAESEHSDDWSD